MPTHPRTRRQLLKLAGTAAAVGLAGCSVGGQNRSRPTETPRSHDHESGHGDADQHGHDHDEGTPAHPSPSAEVAMRTEDDEQHYVPHLVWIEPGGTVTWHVESGAHDTVAYHPENDRPLRMPEGATPWQSELLEAGDSFEHTFEQPGVYDYFCTPHEAVGMVGTVIVGEPDSHGQPALAEPQASLPEAARAELSDLGAMVDEALGHTH